MEKETLARWLKKQVRSIKKKASDIKPAYFPETIHKFRTETKKLRAVVRLMAITADQELNLPKAFHKLYKAAGAIRDMQMQLQYIAADKRHTLPAFAVWLATKTGDTARRWDHKYSKSTVSGLQDYIARLPVPRPDVQTLLRYFKDRMEKMKALTAGDPDDDALHDIRKQAKDMEHVLSILEKDWPEAWRLAKPLEKDLERLSDKAGAYNDRRNLLDGLERFRLEYGKQLDDKQEIQVARAANDWAASKLKERKALLAAIRQLTQRKTKPRPLRPAIA